MEACNRVVGEFLVIPVFLQEDVSHWRDARYYLLTIQASFHFLTTKTIPTTSEILSFFMNASDRSKRPEILSHKTKRREAEHPHTVSS